MCYAEVKRQPNIKNLNQNSKSRIAVGMRKQLASKKNLIVGIAPSARIIACNLLVISKISWQILS